MGTGKYASYELMHEALALSGTECITVAVRRERLVDKSGRNILDFIDLKRYTLLPNTAGCFNAEDAIRTARLGREILLGLENPGADWVKLEVLGDTKTLLPDPIATLAGHREAGGRGVSGAVLHERRSGHGPAAEGSGGDERHAGRQSDRLGAGHSQPEQHPHLPGVSQGGRSDYPVIVDAGVGTASDVTIAMELGVDGVLLNTGIAHARDPLGMARAMKAGVEAGRLAYLAGRIPKRLYATASSPDGGRDRDARSP